MSSAYRNTPFIPPKQVKKCTSAKEDTQPATLESVLALLRTVSEELVGLKEDIAELAQAIEDMAEGDTEEYDTGDADE